ncbi:MAG: c-type cytochrome [Candidatus Limnocylindrales bacterium]
MSDDRSGRELTPSAGDGSVVEPRAGSASVERFDAGERAHRVELTEERAAGIVRQSGSARRVAFWLVLLVVLFIPVYWLYDQGVPFVSGSGAMAQTKDQQYITSVANGYALFLANCSQCHGAQGQGGVGPPLNDQAKLYNALTATGGAGTGHLNPTYLMNVLTVGGRYVCGDANSVMPIWSQVNGGPLNYIQIEDLINWITASNTTSFTYQPPAPNAAATVPPLKTVTGWTDPSYTPPPGQPTPPACWRNPSGVVGGGGGAAATPGTVTNPGTAAAPRIIKLDLTGSLQITDATGAQQTVLTVKAGEVVQFQVTNTANFDHDFFLGTAADLSSDNRTNLQGIAPFSSGTQDFTWTVPASGTLQFACTLPGHYSTMHGDIAIVP